LSVTLVAIDPFTVTEPVHTPAVKAPEVVGLSVTLSGVLVAVRFAAPTKPVAVLLLAFRAVTVMLKALPGILGEPIVPMLK
jgi:hypothetical protein